MIWEIPKIWEDGEVFILGGGPSVIEQFGIPKDVVQSVYEKKVSPDIYSPYLSKLHDKHVIGINAAYKLGQWMDIIFFGDHPFFLENMYDLAKCKMLLVTCHPHTEKYKWVKYLQRDTSKVKGISENPKKVSWNFNSGAASINLAYHLGAKRIILLGFDMTLGENKKQHWHNQYAGKNVKKGLPFQRHLIGFPFIARDAKRLNIEILNASPNSAIQDFKKISIKDIL